jgi:hypothetical protein
MTADRNQLTANVVALDIGTGVWYPSTLHHEGVAPNGCFRVWDEKRGEHVEERPAEAGTMEHCTETADRWNSYKGAKR